MSLPEDEVREARLAANGYNSSSLDAAIGGSEDGESVLRDFIGAEDTALELVEDFHAPAPLIAGLEERDRRIIHMRFVEELTQAEIGERLGVSQMYVSPLLSRRLGRLREGMLADLSRNRPVKPAAFRSGVHLVIATGQTARASAEPSAAVYITVNSSLACVSCSRRAGWVRSPATEPSSAGFRG
ncbi:RNA polymerase sigma factor, sigma-70 family [Streptomyces sp. DconLS]|nr:RNA polymerase sigma factor, sigma-70 family [Streptomyces sp. DconLS]SCF92826.1 RNA polymerase sigma factor, sigma-70 family [Streptomyces sp. LamerLS-31b]